MTGIQSSVGLISGIDYNSLVEQLVKLDGAQRDLLDARTEKLKKQELAITDTIARFVKASYMITSLNKADPFDFTELASSNSAVLTATRNGKPLEGSYQFTPLQMASSQQTVAAGVTSDTQALGKTGTITIGSGRTLENNIALTETNGGDGFAKGYIRVTDGSGTRATIDLRNCTTMNDVIKTINDTTSIDIFAELDGDKLVITDMSGSDKSTLTIAEVSGGRTAASLGILGKANDDGVLSGQSIYRLGTNTRLETLNDGNGIVMDNLLADMIFTCKDGSTVNVDFSYRATTQEVEAGAPEIKTEVTLGDLLDTINNAKDSKGVAGKIRAEIADDGKSLVFHDTTEGTGTTKLTQSLGSLTSPILQSLGLVNGKFDPNTPLTSDTGIFRTRQLIGELDSVLTSSLNGGMGLSAASAGSIEVQDRAGNKATLDFTQAELDSMQTLNDTIKLFNTKLADAEVGISVEMNDQKTGIKVVDTTGKSSANLIFRDKTTTVETPGATEDDAPTTTTISPNIAKSLGLEVNQAGGTANGKSLGIQTVSYSTKLSDMNGGKGVTLAGGKFTVVDSNGRSGTVTIDSSKHKTVGDVINAINGLSTDVIASISENGDGIMLRDHSNGTGNFAVFDSDSTSKFAKELGIAKTVTAADADGRKIIDGTQTHEIEVTEKDTLDDIRKKINELGANYNATIFSDGSAAPYRLMVTGTSTGARGAFNLDLSALGLNTQNMSEAQDAILVYGDPNKEGSLTIHSNTNTFKNAVNGIDLTIHGTTRDPVTVTSSKSSATIKAALKQFVESYNVYQEKYNEDTYFVVNTTTNTVDGFDLANNRVAREFGRSISDILLKRVYGIPGITSLQDIGISIRSNLNDINDGEGTGYDTNKLEFDEDKFDALYASNPDGIREFFFKEQTIIGDDGKETTIKTGWAQKFVDVSDSLVGTDVGIAFKELEKLGNQIDQNTERSEYMSARLEVKRTQLLKKFYNMEQALAKMQSSMSAVSSIATNWSSNYSSTGS